MSSISMRPAVPDQPQRESALDPARSILVQAPAGSGKTDLLARRFLRLLAEVDSPGQIVAITFTKAAAAEMRNRILAELEKATTEDTDASNGLGLRMSKNNGATATSTVTASNDDETGDEFSMRVLARNALARSRALGWNLIELPAQLRISTIDSFCRELALQQPLLSGLGGGLDIREQSGDLYRRAARCTLEQIDSGDAALRAAIRALLAWRDNNWTEIEDLLVDMLGVRHRWMHYFVLDGNRDWGAVRDRLERPFANAIRESLTTLDGLLDQVPNAREEALELAQFACGQSGGSLHRELAEMAEFPSGPFVTPEELEEARQSCACLADLVLTNVGAFRKRIDRTRGFPPDCKGEKDRLLQLIADMQAIPGLESALAAVIELPPARYSDEEWEIVRAAFTLLRAAAAQLKVVFAETGSVDFAEVAQIAESALRGEDGFPSDAAIAAADSIRHLLVDEFQDTSRRQHQLLSSLIAAWSESEGRTCFVVGDPMQSIYFFRDADAELFARIRDFGLDLNIGDQPLRFDHVPLRANFRTAPQLVNHLNGVFAQVFAADDGSRIVFAPAEAAREDGTAGTATTFTLHVDFVPRRTRNATTPRDEADERKRAGDVQTNEIVQLIQERYLHRIDEARAGGGKFRVAVLGRTRKALSPVAEALRGAGIRFRSVDLVPLNDRPEVLDALALARALFNPFDRLAWLGVLRAPWCGLSLADLHILTSADDPANLVRPVPELISEHLHLLGEAGRLAASRLLHTIEWESAVRYSRPTASLGTWLERVWKRLGGEACVDAAGSANLQMLWSCLDGLPNSGQDLLGPALDSALRNMNAQPDPEVSSDCGVQLMTIHKSKGLEFEVVIVPEMQAAERGPSFKMLSWLERGLPEPDESGEATEFLVAPLQPKGEDRGKQREWVENVYRQREKQEQRRLLYVAATRAREELHFFARPSYREQSDGSLALVEPAGSLLGTAWPALQAEIQQRFEIWRGGWLAARATAEPQAGQLQRGQAESGLLDSLAASGDAANLVVMPAPARPARLRRLPPDYRVIQKERAETPASEIIAGNAAAQLYARHEGGMTSRALGSAAHSLLERLAALRVSQDWGSARAALQSFEPRIAAEVRALGLSPDEAGEIATRAMRHAIDASNDPNGEWILLPHPEAASEAQWTGVLDGQLRTVRVDRVFQAGAAPRSDGDTHWWIVDYKTAHPEGLTPQATLPELRGLFAAQLEAYAEVLRMLHDDGKPIRAAIYYPLMKTLDWWEVEL